MEKLLLLLLLHGGANGCWPSATPMGSTHCCLGGCCCCQDGPLIVGIAQLGTTQGLYKGLVKPQLPEQAPRRDRQEDSILSDGDEVTA